MEHECEQQYEHSRENKTSGRSNVPVEFRAGYSVGSKGGQGNTFRPYISLSMRGCFVAGNLVEKQSESSVVTEKEKSRHPFPWYSQPKSMNCISAEGEIEALLG